VKKLVAVLAVLGLLASCSTHRVADLNAPKPGASGTPMGDGDGGGDPGGGVPDYITLGLNPTSQLVHAGDPVYLDLRVTDDQLTPFTGYDGQPHVGFNTWQAFVDYDTTKLVVTPLVPVDNNNGCLMTGNCAGANGVYACGSTITYLTVGPASDPYNVPPLNIPAGQFYVLTSIQCYQTFVDAPGDIWHLRFRTKNDALGTTTIRAHNARFNNGIYYLPLPADVQATVTIGGAY